MSEIPHEYVDGYDPEADRLAHLISAHKGTDVRAEFEALGVNFMTQEVLGYSALNDGSIIELSHGHFMEEEEMFGVTVRKDGKSDHDRSKVLFSADEAYVYIVKLDNPATDIVKAGPWVLLWDWNGRSVNYLVD